MPGRAWLEANLPHRDGMNLLDRVVRWDAGTIEACATGHTASDHPLRAGDSLPAVAGIEYGAQAAAAHGALVAGKPSSSGFLASVRGVRFHARTLDTAAGPLDIRAEQLGASDAGVLYRFSVASSGTLLVEGRVTVAFVA